TPEGLEYIYVKEVTDPSTGFNVRLLNPIVIRLRQEQVVLAYPFKFLSAVNGKASEIVINSENKKNYTGCDDTSSVSSTCGKKFDKGRPVPYSEGFCCFCPETPVRKKQTRGGQDCSKPADPTDIGQKKKASAHCLHLSDVWYSVSALTDPLINHNVFMEVYNQRHLINGSTIWVSLTHAEEFNLGIQSPSKYDENKTIVATFYTANPKPNTNLLSVDKKRLLIPQPMPGVGVDKLPLPVKNGATDFLLLEKSLIEPSGYKCDTAGVSYEGFATQPNRCEKIAQTCLKNQPLEFWQMDHEKRKAGRKGEYLLMNYGIPYKDPITIIEDTKEHWLSLEYHLEQLTMLNVEFNADQIVALTPGRYGQITKIISEALEKKIVFHVYLTNKGLSPANFYVRAIKCEYGVLSSNNVSKIVPPQRMEEFILETKPGVIELAEAFHCSIVAGSSQYGIVAKRDVLVRPKDRCICNMHCKCVCVGESLTCKSMSEEDFQAAGFKASLPELSADHYRRLWIITHPFLFILAILLFLFLLGFTKALLGVMGYKFISYYGLKSRIYGKRRIKHYFEPELKGMDVIYNNEGHPINPDTKERVRVFSEEIIFALNTVFFCLWPYLKIAGYCTKWKKEHGRYDDISSSEDDYFLPGTTGSDTEELSTDGKKISKHPAVISWLRDKCKGKGKEASESVDFEPSVQTPSVTVEKRPSAGDTRRASFERKEPLPKETISDSILETDSSVPLLAKEKERWKKGAHKLRTVMN
ncbi:hypothetical protein NPIL_463671, partial [Nephila pilipes]